MTNILIAGVGGQGTILASRLLASAALDKGFHVRGSETIGMAQRGGSVTSHVRLSGHPIHAPLIGKGGADVVLAFEPGEAARALPFLKPDGAMVVSGRALQPAAGTYDADAVVSALRENVARLTVLDGELFVSECGARCLNVAVLGAALSRGLLPFGPEDMERTLEALLPERHWPANKAALRFFGAP